MAGEIELPLPKVKELKNKLKRIYKKNSPDLPLLINLAETYNNHFVKVNKIVTRDHDQPLKVSLVGGEFTEGSGDVLEQYLEELETLNIWNAFNSAKSTAIESLADKSKAELLEKTLTSWNTSFLATWDTHLELEMTKSLNAKHAAKCQQLLGVYNFTDWEISEQNKNIVKLSKKVVPPLAFTGKEKEARIKEEVLSYAKKYRLYIEKEYSVIDEKDLKWLEKAAAIAKDETHAMFYTTIIRKLNNVPKFSNIYNQQQLRKISQENFYNTKDNPASTIPTKSELIRQLDYNEAIWNDCDKGLGVALIPTKAMKEAERKMVTSLGGVASNMDEKQLVSVMRDKIQSFNDSLDGAQKCLWYSLYECTKEPEMNSLMVPFLNLKLKIHKMRSQDITNKNLGAMKFRPIVDMSRWIFNQHSTALRELVEAMCTQIIHISGNQLKNILPKNGWEVARALKENKFVHQDSVKAMISADLSDAYSMVTLKDLEEAIEYVGEETSMEYWKTELIISLARLILDNNFVETSAGLAKLTSVLAMGMGASPACLNLVGLAAEHRRIVKEPSDKSKAPVNPVNVVDTHGKPFSDCLAYRRYLDDTQALGESKYAMGVKKMIMGIATMFPSTIPINIDCSHIFSNFLDVTAIRESSTGAISTTVKRNITTPPSFVPNKSQVPFKVKMAGLNGDMLRIRRICSKEEYVKTQDTLLKNEYLALGYSSHKINQAMEERREAIKNDFNSDYSRKETVKDMNNLVYGATSKMETGSMTHQVVKEIISSALGDNQARLPILIPATKLGEILHTKQRYMDKLRSSSE